MQQRFAPWCGRVVGAAALLLVLTAAEAAAQQPPLEGAISPEPLEPQVELAPANLTGAEAVLFGLHLGAAYVLSPLLEWGAEQGWLGGGTGTVGGLDIQPGSLGSNSGVGLEVGYVVFDEPVWAGVSAGATTKGYMEHSAFVGLRNLSGSRYARATFTYDLDTEDEFSGLGMGTPEDSETDYRQEEFRILGDAQIDPAANVRAGLRGGYRKNNLLPGKNDDFDDITEVFGDSLLEDEDGDFILPGVSGEEGEYAQGGAFLAFDTRDRAGNPSSGVLLAGSFDAFRGVADTPFDWNRVAGEIAGYVPLPDETRVFAVRLVGVHQAPLHGQPLVPFYYLSSVGGGSVLRSFSSFRFQDNDLLYAAAELRRRVWTENAGLVAVDASLFAESAGVYRDLTEDVELGDMEQSYGTELRIVVPNDVVARLGVAVGGEGSKVYLSGGGRF
jgi:hypothetical protein